MERRTYSVMAVCNPLLDHLNHVSREFLEEIKAVPGTMNLVDEKKFLEIHGKLDSGRIIPGGSSANTLRGIAWLAKSRPVPSPVYFGAVGEDEAGSDYVRLLSSCGVTDRIVRKNARTGASIVAVTPDSQRTMFTFLGASLQVGIGDVDFSLIGEASVFYCAGYMWDSPSGREIINKAAERAHQEKTIFAFDIADPFVV
ncbi:MAG: adenosine kinase, partial [Spirochaetaceae bacterium]